MHLLGTRAGSSPAPAIVLVVAVAAGCAGGSSSLAPGTAPGSAATPSPASWVPTVFPGEGAACLYDENLVPKAACSASLAALAARAP
jgi:hypothetical protein